MLGLAQELMDLACVQGRGPYCALIGVTTFAKIKRTAFAVLLVARPIVAALAINRSHSYCPRLRTVALAVVQRFKLFDLSTALAGCAAFAMASKHSFCSPVVLCLSD